MLLITQEEMLEYEILETEKQIKNYAEKVAARPDNKFYKKELESYKKKLRDLKLKC